MLDSVLVKNRGSPFLWGSNESYTAHWQIFLKSSWTQYKSRALLAHWGSNESYTAHWQIFLAMLDSVVVKNGGSPFLRVGYSGIRQDEA
ncbi:hypothetical protein AVEN_216165-1 [Araneus ventricosus]|uniref:Uncharacterized protein n=1 Tax=Araneus ventricosus TaxID=182803 RepID=A0A4Y2I8T8_ARAVE|nr:hypothetical protein AVEN_216165-1 [Araneus ventricosus]